MFNFEVGFVIPAVLPNDLIVVREYSARQTGFASITVMKDLCSKDVDMEALMWRHMMLGMLEHNGCEITTKLIELFATFPFRIVEKFDDGGYRINAEEFKSELDKLGLN